MIVVFKAFFIIFIGSLYIGDIGFFEDPYLVSKISGVGLIVFAFISTGRSFFSPRPELNLLLLLFCFALVRNLSGSEGLEYVDRRTADFAWLLQILVLHASIVMIERSHITFGFIVNTIIGGAFLSSLMVIIGYGEMSSDSRVSIGGQNENVLAVAFGCAFILTFHRILSLSQVGKVNFLNFVIVILLLNAIFSTGSRSGFIVGIGGAIICLFYDWPRLRSETKVLFGYIFLSSFVIVTLAGATMGDVLFERFRDVENVRELSGRLDYWEEMVTWPGDKWLCGIGVERFETLSLQTYRASRSPHNLFVEMFVIYGVIGLVFILAIYWLLVKSLKYRNLNSLIPCGFFVFLCISLVSHPLKILICWLMLVPLFLSMGSAEKSYRKPRKIRGRPI